MPHVIWDWNGTLLADQQAVVGALNVLLADLGHPPTDLATSRRLYRRPLRAFYADLLGTSIDDALWDHIDRVFHEAYRDLLHDVGLDDHAVAALEAVAPHSQSLLSMAPHDHLAVMVARHGLDHHFVRVDGIRGVGGGRKEAWLRAHLAALDGHARARGDVVMVGDALDDAEAAAATGVRAVLYDGGSHPRAHLEGAGVPVVDTLLDAVAVAGLAD